MRKTKVGAWDEAFSVTRHIHGIGAQNNCPLQNSLSDVMQKLTQEQLSITAIYNIGEAMRLAWEIGRG